MKTPSINEAKFLMEFGHSVRADPELRDWVRLYLVEKLFGDEVYLWNRWSEGRWSYVARFRPGADGVRLAVEVSHWDKGWKPVREFASLAAARRFVGRQAS